MIKQELVTLTKAVSLDLFWVRSCVSELGQGSERDGSKQRMESESA